MSRSTRGTPLIAAPFIPAAAASWSDVPDAAADDLIVTPYSAYQSQLLDPGVSYTARAGGMADYCAATDPNGVWPCPSADYSTYFHINSTTVAAGLQATMNITVTNAPDGFDRLGIESGYHDTREQVFSAGPHGRLYWVEVIGGQRIGRLDEHQIVCAVGVPCDVSFSLCRGR